MLTGRLLLFVGKLLSHIQTFIGFLEGKCYDFIPDYYYTKRALND